MGKFGFGGFSKANLFGGRGHGRGRDDRDHDRDDDDRDGHGTHHGHQADGCGTGNDSGGNGGGAVNGNNFADIPNDTTGVTFTIDVGRNGTDDDYYVVRAPQGVDPATLTMQTYYDIVAQDIAAKYPNTPPGQIVVKATIYSASQGESYQFFNGTEKTTAELNAGNADDDEDDDHHGGGKDDDHHGSGKDDDHHGGGKDDDHHGGGKDDDHHGGGKDDDHHGGGKDDDHHGGGKDDDDHGGDKDDDNSGDDHHAGGKDEDDKDDKGHGGQDDGDFYANLMGCGDAPAEDDHGSHDDSQEDHADDLIFC